MTRKRLLPTIALLAALSLVVAACGQKSGVHLATGGDGLTGATSRIPALRLQRRAQAHPCAVGALCVHSDTITFIALL